MGQEIQVRFPADSPPIECDGEINGPNYDPSRYYDIMGRPINDPLLRIRACKLRKKGNSLGAIAKKLSISKNTASLWVRKVELTEKQKEYLRFIPVERAKKSSSFRAEQRRKRSRLDGANRIKEKDWIAGCMLYWAEGKKSKFVVSFCNSDPDMIRFFWFRFAKKYFSVPDSKASISINCYCDQENVETIESFWLSLLRLPRSRLRKATIKSPQSARTRKKKLKYGICTIWFCNSEAVEQIIGFLEDFVGFKRKGWNSPNVVETA